jgi:hypothetical protein
MVQDPREGKRLSLHWHFAHSNQQLQKYYKAFRRLMLRSIQTAMGGNTRNASKHENAETLETIER